MGSSLNLEEVLHGVVKLLSDASAVHACFVYLLEREGKRLVLRAASAPYTPLVGEIELKRGEGLAWWALENREAAFIRENALEDPRVKYVPELEEEKFQSLVAIPVLGKRGDPIGAFTLHTVAPREFTDAEVGFLVSSASLVAGAIENARLFDETRKRVGELEYLTELAEALAVAETLAALGDEVVAGSRDLLRAENAHLYLLDTDDERLHLHSSAPPGASAPTTIGLTDLGPEVGRNAQAPRVTVTLVAGGELLGALVAEGTREVDLARTVANQAAVAVKKIQVLERLTEKNLIKDFFDDLAARRLGPALEGRAARVGCDLERPYVVLAAVRTDERFENALRALVRGSILDTREQALRALAPVGARGTARLVDDLARVHGELGATGAVGLSGSCVGAEALAHGFEEARHALLGEVVIRGDRGVMTYEELGPYKYLLRIALEPGVRDSTIEAVGMLETYDRERNSSLLPTLEEFLRRRGNISGTSEALFVHPNTLRQRLRRIADLTGIDLRRDDWLMIEIATKLVRLRTALPDGDPAHMIGVEMWRNPPSRLLPGG
ncbi:MAG: GAF domain-containing protein [Thermoleophilia bacterium]|nr:GAF domain-containing protein [Thermoleophilia bacterium]